MAARTQRSLLVVLLTAFVALSGLVGAPGAAAASTGDVYILQGMVGTTADIYVDDNRVQPNAAAKQVVGPLRLSPGNHTLALKTGDTEVVSAKFVVQAGKSVDVVTHRTADADRKPIVTVFANDLSALAAGKSRLVVSHVAVAPAVDVLIDGSPLLRNIASGESLSVVVPAGPATLSVVPTATQGTSLISGTTVTLGSGMLTRAFMIGDSSDKTTDGLVQYIKVNVVGSSAAPTVVKTGDGGQAAGMFYGYGSTLAWWAAFATLLATFAVVRLNRRFADRLVIGSRHSR